MIITITTTTIRPTKDVAVGKTKVWEPATTLTSTLQINNAFRSNTQLALEMIIIINKTADNVRPSKEKERNPDFVVHEVVVDNQEAVKTTSKIENRSWCRSSYKNSTYT